MLITPKDWVCSFVGRDGKSRDEMVEAAWRTFGWNPHTVDDAIRDAAAAGDIEQAVFGQGLVRGAATVDQAFRKKSGARWRVKSERKQDNS